jgi:hypothetical protein
VIVATIIRLRATEVNADGEAVGDGSDTVSITVAQDQAGVDRSNEVAAGWLREHASDIQSSPPRITEGEVRLTISGG